LSTGATVGLGVGAALGGVLLAAVIIGVWLCIRKRARAAAVQTGQAPNVFPKHAELSGQQSNYSELPVYTQTWTGPPPVEMPATPGHNHWHPGERYQTQQNHTVYY
jgi:hypothetical protein